MEIDFKITTWERVTIAPEDEAKVLKALKSGEIQTANDVFEFADSTEYFGKIDETETTMTVEENDGYSTIDVSNNGNSVWTNSEK